MNAVISSIESSLEKPAAWRWPPPPDARAIAETSTRSDDERSEILRASAAVARRLADQGGELDALDRTEHVDDALGVRLDRSDLAEVAPHEVG